MKYYQKEIQYTRLNEETGELLHIFVHNNSITVSKNLITLNQINTVITTLDTSAQPLTAEEFAARLETAKTTISSL